MQLLQDANETVQLHALSVLHSVVADADGQLAVGGAGGAEALVQLIDGSFADVRCEAIGILCQLANQAEQLPSLIAAGAVPPLVGQLRDGSAAAQEAAAGAVRRLSGAEGGPGATVRAFGIQPLVALLHEASASTQAHAMYCMHNLASCAATSRALAGEVDAIAACVHVLSVSSDDEVRAASAATLACVADEGSRADIVAAGGVEALLGMLERGDESGASHSVRAICSLAEDVGSHGAISCGLPALVSLAACGAGASQAHAVSTVHKLSTGGERNALSALARSAATIRLLVQRLGDGTTEQTAAARSLRHLCADEVAAQSIVDASGVASLVSVAQACGSAASARRDAALVLARLASPPHSAAVASSGGTQVLIGATVGSDAELTAAAAGALERLVVCDEGRSTILACGVGPCVQLLQDANETVQLHALSVLRHTIADAAGLSAVAAAQAAVPLLHMLPKDSAVDSAAFVLHRLSTDELSCAAIAHADGSAQLVPLLASTSSDVGMHTLITLAAIVPHMQTLRVGADAVAHLAAFSRDSRPQCCDSAAAVLALVAEDGGHAQAILCTGGAQGLLRASHSASEADVRVRAGTALDHLAAALFGPYTEAMRGSALLDMPLFWCEPTIGFLQPSVMQHYPSVVAAPSNFYFELVHFCLLVMLRRAGASSEADELRKALEPLKAVLEILENESKALGFFAGIFHHVAARSRTSIADFERLNISHLPDLAHLGVEVLNRVRGMELAETALMSLYYRYLTQEEPSQWKMLFKESTKTAYCLKYMFRESLPKAKAHFLQNLDRNLSGQPRELFSRLVDGAFRMYRGLVDQQTLASTDFLTNAQSLVDVVLAGVSDEGTDPRVRLLGEIAAKYMQTYIDHDPPKLPLTPHHTQVVAMLLFSQFFEEKERWLAEFGQKSIILQMATGEGKSIVIAMMAIYTVKQLGKRVHVLENNEGLLQRDFKTYEPFYRQFGLTCSKTIDATSDICYCLKKHNNAFFNERMLEGDLDLSGTVLIVDEVDDLVVNEKPSLLYTKRDETLTPKYEAAYLALIGGAESPPGGVERAVWDDCVRIKRETDSKVEGLDFAKSDGGWAMLEMGPDGTPRPPKVPLTDDWLVYKNLQDFELPPSKDTFRSSLCTPYMYNKYACIFGLTGSVGGEAERAYIQKTYLAVPYEVPQFLHTCEHTHKDEARNLGVFIRPSTAAMIDEVVATAKRHYRDVPVLIITRGAESDELRRVYNALYATIAEDPDEPMPRASAWARRMRRVQGIQRLQERNDNGELMVDECDAIVERATKRCYNDAREAYFRVTVTDWFGGRGHDFDCMDERANAAGGMLVITTSVPDAREWTQWKGRTARQDRPGQYMVVLSAEEEPFRSEAGLAEALGASAPNEAVAALLERKDTSIRESLLSFEAQQARGAWQNELCERYYCERPRAADACWPSVDARATDLRLRDLLRVPFGTGEKLKDAASARLGITLEGPPAQWGWRDSDAFGIEPKRKEMAVIFLIDRTYEKFLQKVVDAVLKVYDTHLEEDDLVGYYGLGDGWIFEMERKGERPAALREQIATSVEKRGDPHVYSSIEKCVGWLSEVDERYAKWLVVLTDTADFECTNEKNAFDAGSAERAKGAAQRLIGSMREQSGLNLVLIDAHELGNFNAKHSMWPTWHALSKQLTDEVGDGNMGLNIQAAEESQIDEAFDKVAGAMQGGAAE